MRHITKEGLELIQRFEGFSATPYLCPAGYLTVGYGHVVKNPDDFHNGISEQEALTILAADVQTAEHAVLRLIYCSRCMDSCARCLISNLATTCRKSLHFKRMIRLKSRVKLIV